MNLLIFITKIITLMCCSIAFIAMVWFNYFLINLGVNKWFYKNPHKKTISLILTVILLLTLSFITINFKF